MLSFFKKKPVSEPTKDRKEPAESSQTAADATGNLTPTPLSATSDEFDQPLATLSSGALNDAKTLSDESQPGWRDRFRGSIFTRNLSELFVRKPPIDDDLFEAIETALLAADVGVPATESVVAALREQVKRGVVQDSDALIVHLRSILVDLLRPIAVPLDISSTKPFVVLTVGVNGVGKTTTIGKLARRYADERKQVMLAAGDTFRAAAVEQLQQWGQRNQVPVVAQGAGADSASVAFDAAQMAKTRGIDLLIVDTAGRLHTQSGLMDELAKVKRVLAKADPSSPHEVLLVIDGTTGQNAINQLKHFHKAVGVTGLVVTKLDGSAKGGVVFALAREFGIPIRFVGLGEKVHDLRTFDADAFVDAMLPPDFLAG